jgi:solute carrier family 34 (sodium-dependent phosphate cotransporter)
MRVSGRSPGAAHHGPSRSGLPGRALLLVGLLYAFFVGLDLLGVSFKLFGKGFAEQLIATTSDPLVGLLVGILATSLVQSSSTTTSMTVGLVAAGGLTLEGAIPIIMGANVGTSVTNTLVSLGHVTRREEFRRAFAGATLHDVFNWMTVMILLPVEIATGYLARSAAWIEKLIEGAGGLAFANPLKAVVRPAADLLSRWTGGSGAMTLLLGLGLLFLALKYLVDLLKVMVAARAENLFDRTLFRSAPAAILAGALITFMVQSSSITTSIVVPLVGAGVVTLEQLFPFTIGANVGTTGTALLAALATGSPTAVSVALAHLLFNVTGTLLIYPVPLLRRVPIAVARALGALGARNRLLAMVYVVLAFFGLPLLLLAAGGRLSHDEPKPPVPMTPPAVSRPSSEEVPGV